MNDRFDNSIPEMPDTDEEKCELACKLLCKKMESDGMPFEVAVIAANVVVSDALQATIAMREQAALRWKLLSTVHYN